MKALGRFSISGEQDDCVATTTFCGYLPMFQMFHEVIVHQSPLDQLPGPAQTQKEDFYDSQR